MEATGVYWLPIWYALEDAGFVVQVVNAGHVKRLPGRKTDVKDAEWLAQLTECGLLRPSFMPPQQIRELRDLTRYRAKLVEEQTREQQRLTKVLEDAQIKLGSVASDVLGVSGRRMLTALVDGERDPDVLAEMALGRLRNKAADLGQALTGRFNEHHAFMVRLLLDHIDALDDSLGRLDREIQTVISPFAHQVQLLTTIPGVGQRTAEAILAETGPDMSQFPTAACLASWAGVCPGHHESAGKHHSGRTRRGDKWLRTTLVQCAWSASHTKDTYLSAQFWRLQARRGDKRAAVAVAHSILVAVWHMLTNDETYQDLGGDYFTRRLDKQTEARRLLRRLQALGMEVTVADPAA
jgi:transposase